MIGSSRSFNDENGNHVNLHYFQTFKTKQLEYVPEDDVLTCCEEYFKTLLNVVLDCYKTFGNEIDPELFYTYKNLVRTGKTVEDFEEQAGIQRGWTGKIGLSKKERIDFIRKYQPMPTIDWVFEKYLGVNRFGKKVDEE